MSTRRTAGSETWHRLLEWDRGQAPSERLAAQILQTQGYTNIDPSHPLGGKDGLRDAVCQRGGERWIASAYFPRGQQDFRDVKEKFCGDARGIEKHNAKGIAFVTNQELRLGQREELCAQVPESAADILHLERIAFILNSATCYGLRLEFLDIEMAKEEQLAVFALLDSAFLEVRKLQQDILTKVNALAENDSAASDAKSNPNSGSGFIRYPKSGVPILSFSGDKFVNCRKCDGGFLIHSWQMNSVLRPSLIGCPHCGDVQQYSTSPFGPFGY